MVCMHVFVSLWITNWICLAVYGCLEGKTVTIYYTNVSKIGCFEFKNVTKNHSLIHVNHDSPNTTLFVILPRDILTTDPYKTRTKVQNFIDNIFKFCIMHISFTDAGCYVFKTSHGIQATVKAFVLGKPTKPEIWTMDNGKLNIGLAIMYCNSSSISKPTGLNLTYTWLVNKRVINESRRYKFKGMSNSELHIRVRRNESSFVYSCFATEDHGQMSDISEGKVLNPERSPIVTLKPQRSLYTVFKGRRMSIECIVKDANPDVTSITWLKGDKKIKEVNFTMRNIYTIHNVSIDDTAVYTCSAFNGIGEGGRANISVEVLNTTLPPSSNTAVSKTVVEVIVVVTVLCLFFLITCIIAAALVRKSKPKRQTNENAQRMGLLMATVERQNSRSDSDLGAYANPCDMPSNANNDEEHEMENKRDKGKNDAPRNAEYAQVVKRKVKQNAGPICVQGGDAEIREKTERSQKKSNNRIKNDGIKYAERKSKGQLVYSDLDFVPSGDKRFVIREPEQNTNYVDIDFSKHAEPLPDDTSDVSDAGQSSVIETERL